MSDDLRSPATDAEWLAYHTIRRDVLFDRRGRGADYNPEHPDEHRPNNHPLVLWHSDVPVAVLRIDIDNDVAIFRRVAVREDLQRRGFGRRMLTLAEHFARRHGCSRVDSHVDLAAVGFYERCGFQRVANAASHSATLLMTKSLTGANEIAGYYDRGLERDRLASGAGALELARTQALLERYLPAPPAVIADVGGGPGRYAVWLAERGYRVHLVDPIPLHIEQAREAAPALLASAEVGDARSLALHDASVDAVLLLGPLYHLTERADRVQALAEARRVCRPGGVIVAAAISRFASTLDGLRGGYLEDSAFAAIAAGDLRDGQHRNPTEHPGYFTTAYFHRPEELATECAAAGLAYVVTLAVEGVAWLLPDLDARLADARRRAVLLEALAALEADPTLLGVSAHLIAIARRA